MTALPQVRCLGHHRVKLILERKFCRQAIIVKSCFRLSETPDTRGLLRDLMGRHPGNTQGNHQSVVIRERSVSHQGLLYQYPTAAQMIVAPLCVLFGAMASGQNGRFLNRPGPTHPFAKAAIPIYGAIIAAEPTCPKHSRLIHLQIIPSLFVAVALNIWSEIFDQFEPWLSASRFSFLMAVFSNPLTVLT